VAPGRREAAVSDDVRDLGAELFGTRRHWHKRIVRSGPNTLKPYGENPPDRVITDDDIFDAHPDVTGEQLFGHVAERAGWAFGGPHSGHLVGEFPHETIDGDRIESYIALGNDTPMRRLDRAGRVCHWILEVHLVDRARGFGGFFEQLLTLRGPET
jgi:hypothetical protein